MSDLDEREEQIARRAAELVFQQVYAEIGRSMVKRVWWLFLIAVGGLASLYGYAKYLSPPNNGPHP